MGKNDEKNVFDDNEQSTPDIKIFINTYLHFYSLWSYLLAQMTLFCNNPLYIGPLGACLNLILTPNWGAPGLVHDGLQVYPVFERGIACLGLKGAPNKKYQRFRLGGWGPQKGFSPKSGNIHQYQFLGSEHVTRAPPQSAQLYSWPRVGCCSVVPFPRR